MSQKITLEKIARAANVSPATVSRALNKTGRVSPDVERRVRIAMARLTPAARKGSKPCVLCFILANRTMLHAFHARVLVGAQQFASEHDSHLLFYVFNYSSTTAAEELRLPSLIDGRGLVDGFIVGGMNSPNLLEHLSKTRIPYSVLGNNVSSAWKPEEVDAVWMDDTSGAYEATQHLQGLGHRAIAFLNNTGLPTSRIYDGYAKAMQEAGLEAQSIDDDSLDERDGGYLAAKRLLSSTRQATAVFCATDSIAHGAMEAIAASGLRVPEDISVIGFGDRPEAGALTPPLSSVWGYPDQVGRRLAELVLSRIANPDRPPERVVLATRLIRRASCAKPRTQESASNRSAMEVAPRSSSL